jgi:hydrogenase 3 maturation protease
MINSWARVLEGKVVLVGIGNLLRGDDAFGPRLIERIQGKIRAVCIDAGSAPENYSGKIVKENPDTIVLVDAVHLDQTPGECALLRKSDIVKTGFTTHDMSPSLFIDHLESRTQADIYLLGVQPETLSMGADLSEPVKRTLDKLAADLLDSLGA